MAGLIMFVPKSLLTKWLVAGGVALATEERCISSLDSWENLPESPVSWLPSLLAECSVSAAILNGTWKLDCWPGELGESSSLISTVVLGWYRHTAWTNLLWGYIKSREEKVVQPLKSWAIVWFFLLHFQSSIPPECLQQHWLRVTGWAFYSRLRRINLKPCAYFSILDEAIPSCQAWLINNDFTKETVMVF